MNERLPYKRTNDDKPLEIFDISVVRYPSEVPSERQVVISSSDETNTTTQEGKTEISPLQTDYFDFKENQIKSEIISLGEKKSKVAGVFWVENKQVEPKKKEKEKEIPKPALTLPMTSEDINSSRSKAKRNFTPEEKRQIYVVIMACIFVVLVAAVAATIAVLTSQRRSNNNDDFPQDFISEAPSSSPTFETDSPSMAPSANPNTRGKLSIAEFLQSAPDLSVISRISEPVIFEELSDTSSRMTMFAARDQDIGGDAALVLQQWRQPRWTPQLFDSLQTLILPIELREIPSNGTLRSLSGNELVFGNNKVNTRDVIETERYFGVNGVVHLTRGVVLPNWYNISVNQMLRTDFPRFYRLLTSNGVLEGNIFSRDTIDRSSPPVTVLLPSDAVLDELENVVNEEQRKRILSYHILPNINFSLQYLDQGYLSQFQVSDGTLRIPTKSDDASLLQIDPETALVDGSVPLAEKPFILGNGIIQPLLGSQAITPRPTSRVSQNRKKRE